MATDTENLVKFGMWFLKYVSGQTATVCHCNKTSSVISQK